jgi:hypothetical protein
LNLDGIDDLGLWVPNRQGSPTPTTAEWYFLLSDHTFEFLPSAVFEAYSPTPLGNDVFAQFGDHFTLPIFGNFDPPVAPSPVSETNILNSLDVDNDGYITPTDVLTVINRINTGETKATKAANRFGGPYVDVNGDVHISPVDVLAIVNYINGESDDPEDVADIVDDYLASDDDTGEGEAFSSIIEDDLLNLLAYESATAKKKG